MSLTLKQLQAALIRWIDEEKNQHPAWPEYHNGYIRALEDIEKFIRVRSVRKK